MKKNIQINLFGTIYNIDDDAYRLLDRYLESMKQYFMRQEGGEEIADDIEHRVAELLWQRRQQGMEAVSIDTIKQIISQIGNPQEIDGEYNGNGNENENENENEDENENGNGNGKQGQAASAFDNVRNHISGRRLYRDTRDKLLGGVCGGLAEYIGWGDVTMWRLLFAVMPFVLSSIFSTLHLPYSGFWLLPVTYLILWIVVPEAHTAEDRLRMKGQEVTPENINEEIINDSTSNTTHEAYSANTSSNSGCLTVMLKVMLVLIALPILAVLAGVVFVLIAIVAGMIGFAPQIAGDIFGSSVTPLANFMRDDGWLLMTGIVAGLLVIGIPLYILVKMIMKRQFSRYTLPTLIILWLLMTSWTIFCSVRVPQKLFQKAGGLINMPSVVWNDSTITTVNPPNTMEELVDTAAIDLRSE